MKKNECVECLWDCGVLTWVSSTQGDGGEEEWENSRVQIKAFGRWRKSFTHKQSKTMPLWIHSSFPMGRQVLGQDKCHHSRHSQLCILAWCSMVWDIPGVGSAPPSSSCTPSPCRWGEEQRSAQQSLKHPCVISSFQHKYKMWLHQLLQRKLTLSQPNPETEKKPLWGDGVEVVNCLPFRSVQTSRIPGNFLSFSPFCHTF